ncbi:hypothetical protein Scep_027690 [Stephania cephalantha]|uniref:Uncharacterized protein n=1 Tax=Stephania cephalantha TaxID=152367 RepID=A0AAP0EBN6_9MAGN
MVSSSTPSLVEIELGVPNRHSSQGSHFALFRKNGALQGCFMFVVLFPTSTVWNQ